MKTIRTREDDLAEMLSQMKVGDSPLYDMETNYEITRVPNGYIYRREYEGICFVPFETGGNMAEEKPKLADKTVAKVEPKETVKKTEPKKIIKK